jgi:hypothetical protein
MIPLPDVKEEWQDDDDPGFRKISGRDAELACARLARCSPLDPYFALLVQQEAATPPPHPPQPAPAATAAAAADAASAKAPGEAGASAASGGAAATAGNNSTDHAAAASASAPAATTPQPVEEDLSIPKHFVEAHLPPTPDGSATVNPAAVVDEDPFERFDLKARRRKHRSLARLI